MTGRSLKCAEKCQNINSFSTSNIWKILIQLEISRLQNFQLCQESAIFPNSPDHGHFPKTPNFANVPLTNWGVQSSTR